MNKASRKSCKMFLVPYSFYNFFMSFTVILFIIGYRFEIPFITFDMNFQDIPFLFFTIFYGTQNLSKSNLKMNNILGF